MNITLIFKKKHIIMIFNKFKKNQKSNIRSLKNKIAIPNHIKDLLDHEYQKSPMTQNSVNHKNQKNFVLLISY